MNLLLMGSEGSIGKRYKAILNHLVNIHKLNININFYDIKNKFRLIDYSKIDSLILATPTETHFDVLSEINRFYEESGIKKPKVLCEKPISKNITETKKITEMYEDFQMIFQYGMYFDDHYISNLDFSQYDTSSLYNFYNTGNDGLFWDLIQVIALHKGSMEKLYLRNESPIWKCVINDRDLGFSKMQDNYISYIYNWLVGERELSKENIIKIHQKVIKYIEFAT